MILVLAESGVLEAGTPLEVVPEVLPADAASRDSRAFRARVGDPASPRRSVIWELDGQPYSPTDLTCKLWREYGVQGIGPSYYSHWRIVGHNRSLWDEAKALSMTEATWRSGAEPYAMLEYLQGRASQRKMRLFACACCRSVWHLLQDPASRAAVEMAERYADGQASEADLAAARDAAGHVRVANAAHGAATVAATAACLCAWAPGEAAEQTGRPAGLAQRVAGAVFDAAMTEAGRASEGQRHRQQLRVTRNVHAAQGQMIRDLFGNPFAPLPAIDPAWLVRGGGIFASWHGSLTMSGPLTGCRSWPMRWRRPGAPTPSCSGICGPPGRTSAAAGRSI